MHERKRWSRTRAQDSWWTHTSTIVWKCVYIIAIDSLPLWKWNQTHLPVLTIPESHGEGRSKRRRKRADQREFWQQLLQAFCRLYTLEENSQGDLRTAELEEKLQGNRGIAAAGTEVQIQNEPSCCSHHDTCRSRWLSKRRFGTGRANSSTVSKNPNPPDADLVNLI